MRRMIGLLVTAAMLVVLIALPAAAVNVYMPGDGGTMVNTTVPNEREWVETGRAGRAEDGSIQIAVNGRYVRGDVKPFIDDAYRTQAPFRMISEALGCVVEWEEDTQKVTCTKEGYMVEMFIGNSTYWVNGQPLVMDTAPQLRDSRTFIPVRALAEALGCEVFWNEAALLVLVRGIL